MEFTASKEALAKDLARLAAVADDNDSTFRRVLVEAEGGSVTLTASNRRATLQTRLPAWAAEVVRPGAFAHPAKALADLVKNAPGDRPAFSLSDGGLVVSGPEFTARLVGFAPVGETFRVDPWPEWSDEVPEGSGESWGFLLTAAVGRACQAAARDESDADFKLDCVKVEAATLANGLPGIRFVSTDTRLLVVSEAECEKSRFEAPDEGALVSVKALRAIQALCATANKVRYSLGPAGLIAETAASRVIARPLDGSFPDWTRVLEGDWVPAATFSRDDLRSALRAARVVKGNTGSAAVRIGRKSMTVSVSGGELGDAEIGTPLADAAAKADGIGLALDPGALLGVVSAMDSQKGALKLRRADDGGLETNTVVIEDGAGDPDRHDRYLALLVTLGGKES